MMTITETIPVEVATVQVDDDYRVELAQVKKLWSYSPDQSRALGNALITAAAGAEAALNAMIDESRDRMEAAAIRTDLGQVVL